MRLSKERTYWNSTIRIRPKKYRLVERPRKAGKRKKLPTVRSLVKKADLVFSLWVRKRDGFKCVLASEKCKGPIQCGHLIKRGKKAVRWDEVNCNALCSYHNYLDNMEPQHYLSWWLRNYGATLYQDLVDRSRRLFKPSREFLLSIIEKYK